jgi:hypothetical protein
MSNIEGWREYNIIQEEGTLSICTSDTQKNIMFCNKRLTFKYLLLLFCVLYMFMLPAKKIVYAIHRHSISFLDWMLL